MSNATSSRAPVSSVAPVPSISASVAIPRASSGARQSCSPKPTTVAFAVADISALAKSLRAAAAEMVAARLLLPQDAERAAELAAKDQLSQLQ